MIDYDELNIDFSRQKIADIVRQARKTRTVEQLAEEVGVSRRQVYAWLNKESSITSTNLGKLLSLPGLDPRFGRKEYWIIRGSDGHDYVCEPADSVSPGDLIIHDGILGFYSVSHDGKKHSLRDFFNVNRFTPMPEQPDHRVIGLKIDIEIPNQKGLTHAR